MLLTTLAVGIPAFFLGPVLFPAPSGAPAPSIVQMLFIVLLGVAESLALGLGISFVLFGWARVLNSAGPPGPPRKRALAVCLSVTWLLVSWWPHDNLHRYVGEGVQNLLYLESGFQITLMACGAILAYALLSRDPLLKEIRQITRIV